MLPNYLMREIRLHRKFNSASIRSGCFLSPYLKHVILYNHFSSRDYFFLPVTPDGYHVIFHALKDPKTSSYHFENAVKSTFMLIDACLNVQGPRKGLIILFDMKGVSIFHLMRTNLSGLRKFFHYLQECLPSRLHRIHVMNVVPFFDAVLKLIKPFMKPELFEMVS